MAGSIIKSVAGPIAGAATSSLFGGAGDDAERYAAQASQVFTPKPFRAASSLFNVGASGRAGYTPFGRNQFSHALGLSNAALNRYRNFDRGAFADRLLEAANRVNDKREDQAFRSLESKLFNRAGASTGTQRQIADFQSDIEDRRFQRALNAQIAADDFGRNRFNEFQAAFNNLMGFEDRRDRIQRLSLDGGQALLPKTANNPGMANLSAFAAQNNQNFASGLGSLVGGAVQTGVNRFFGGGVPNASSSTYVPGGGFFNPGAIDFGSNPFVP